MTEIYEEIKDALRKYPFVTVIGKFDQIVGPSIKFSSYPLKNDRFIKELISDAINTEHKFVILDHDQFYSQVCKVDIKDETARGGTQVYAIILLRDSDHLLIPRSNFEKIEKIFIDIDDKKILSDDKEVFNEFSEKINKIYKEKREILPLEAVFKQVRTGLNTIQGYCELLLEMMEENAFNQKRAKSSIKMMLSSCNEIINALKGEKA